MSITKILLLFFTPCITPCSKRGWRDYQEGTLCDEGRIALRRNKDCATKRAVVTKNVERDIQIQLSKLLFETQFHYKLLSCNDFTFLVMLILIMVGM